MSTYTGVTNCQKTVRFFFGPPCISEGSRCTLTQKIPGKSPQGFPQGFHPRMPRHVFLSPIQRGLSATYPARILTAFEIKDVNRCVHADTGENFRISAEGVLQVLKTAKMGIFEGVFVMRLQLKRPNFRQCESFRGLVDIKDVRFVSEFWCGMYGLGAISPRKQQILTIGARPYFTVQHHSPGGSMRHALFESILQ